MEIEKTMDANRTRMTEYDNKIAERFQEERLAKTGDKPDPVDWAELIQADPDFAEEFTRTFDNTEIKEADQEFDPAMSANAIAENILSQVDPDGQRLLTFDCIIGHRTDGTEFQEKDAFVLSSNGVKRRREMTAGWEINIRWKDGETTWNKLKDVKDAYPTELADYAIEQGIDSRPAFKWWIPFVIKKRDRIIAKAKVSYWQTTHKYGLEVLKNYRDCVCIGTENNNNLWQDATRAEMKTVRPAFEIHQGSISDLVAYQKINCHLV